MSKNLVIVESPTKAKTIDKILGEDFKVESSYGHVRDLPKNELGVDVENKFKPKYVIPTNAKKYVNKLKKTAKQAKQIYFATDEDREGEAIAWHLIQVIKPKKEQIKRVVFHEITKKAILEAFKHPRDINYNLVDAQQARRILDRLVGYKLSPFLWKKVRPGLSAGRVQSVAVRLIVDRERKIEAFKPQEYWTIQAELKRQSLDNKRTSKNFIAKLIKKNRKVIPKLGIKNKGETNTIIEDLKNAEFKVIGVKQSKKERTPAPPFITSTLQQEAIRKLGFTAKQTMLIAQQLYEGIKIGEEGQIGLITYMRTDSTNLSGEFLDQAKKLIKQKFGKQYCLTEPRIYKIKIKSAQEAHEAIRPTNVFRIPSKIKNFLDLKQYKLYNLIWKRAIASQMEKAEMNSISVDISAKNYLFRATGSVIKFDGFLKVYIEESGKEILKETFLPPLKQSDNLILIKLIPEQHFTQPPPRYTEASLVKTLEEEGIGRPSTYAPILSTITERGYVEKINKQFFPKDIGVLVNDLLVNHFPKIVDIQFTASMEKNLDRIAQNKIERQEIIKNFYDPFQKNLIIKEKELSKKELTEEKTEKKCPKCGKPLVIKLGRFGKFLACTGYPECKYTEPIGEEKKLQEEYSKEKCKKCNSPMVVKTSRFGKFLACSRYPECKFTKPIIKSTGVKCPKCNKGEIVERNSKKGRTFYSCNRFPKCRLALWQKPTGEKCPKCENLLVYGTKGKNRCSNKECGFEKG